MGSVENDGLVIDSCYNTGNINHPSCSYVGGIIGYGYSKFTMTNVYNEGEVSGKMYTGGIVGLILSSSSSVNKAYNTGKVTGNGTSEYDGYVGGVFGKIENGKAVNVYNTGEVLASKTAYVGGITGYNNTNISNSSNLGNVTGSKYVGGITGYAMSPMENAYNIGTVTGDSDVGIVIAWTNSSTKSSENLYYLSSLSGNAIGTFAGPSADQEELTGKMVSKAEAEMKSQTFVDLLNTNKSGIDGAVNWKLDNKTGYPILDFTVVIEDK